MKISAAIICKNEEKHIENALRSVAWADEVIVVDSGSTDATLEIAERLGARILMRDWTGFAAQKQFAVDNAAYDWIFSLDSDEVVSDALVKEIETVKTNTSPADGYRISRLSYYMGHPIKHSGWYPDEQLRLFDRRKGRWKQVIIHESVEMASESRVETLDSDILHYSVENVAHHHRMIGERYAPLAAEQMFARGRRTTPFKTKIAGPSAFLRSYILKAGFLDGFPGYCIAKFAAHHAFLKHLLLYEMQTAERDDK